MILLIQSSFWRSVSWDAARKKKEKRKRTVEQNKERGSVFSLLLAQGFSRLISRAPFFVQRPNQLNAWKGLGSF